MPLKDPAQGDNLAGLYKVAQITVAKLERQIGLLATQAANMEAERDLFASELQARSAQLAQATADLEGAKAAVERGNGKPVLIDVSKAGDEDVPAA